MFLSVKPLANIVSNYACHDRNYKRQYTVHNNHPLSKKAGFGQRKDYSTKLTFRTVFQKMRLCFFGAILVWRIRLIWRIFFCVVEGGAISLFCVRMYCIFSTLPLDVENTVIRTQSLKVTVSVGEGLILLF